MDKKQLERRLRTIREPAPPGDLALRLEQGIPDSLRRPEPGGSPWRLGMMVKIGAVTAAAAAGVWAVSLLVVGTMGVHVAVAEVLAPVAEATGSAQAVHMVLRMLTREGESFSFVNLEGKLLPVEVYLEAPSGGGEPGRVRLEKGDRIYAFDGRDSVLYFPKRNDAYRDVGLENNLFWPAEWVRAIQHLPPGNVEVLAHEEKNGEGRLLLRARGVEMKPLEPSFFDQFDRETEVIWDLGTHRLKQLRRWVEYKGERRLFLEIASINYPPPFSDALFRLELPSGVRWGGLKDRPVPEDQAGLGPREVARAIFEAAIHRDRKTLELYDPSPSRVDWFMTHSLEVISLGEPFQAGNYPGFYVPYEVRVGVAGVFTTTKKHNLALRNDNPQGRWELDGGW